MKVIGSKTSFQNHQPSKLHFVSGADEKRKFSRPAENTPCYNFHLFVQCPKIREVSAGRENFLFSSAPLTK